MDLIPPCLDYYLTESVVSVVSVDKRIKAVSHGVGIGTSTFFSELNKSSQVSITRKKF